jgi:uncharacterized protein (TIGR03083 family)
MRTFDTWVHGQDIRQALGLPGAINDPAARVAAEQVAGALGYVWAKRVDAPRDATLVVDVLPPGISFSRAVRRSADGRGESVPVPLGEPTVQLRLKFADFIQVGCGRSYPGRTLAEARDSIEIVGDDELGRRVIDSLNIAP